jgi:hypothetical protein
LGAKNLVFNAGQGLLLWPCYFLANRRIGGSARMICKAPTPLMLRSNGVDRIEHPFEARISNILYLLFGVAGAGCRSFAS